MKRYIAVCLVLILMAAAGTGSAGAAGLLDKYADRIQGMDRLGVVQTNDSIWEYDEDTLLSVVDWETLYLDEETAQRCPELASVLEADGRQRSEDAETLSAELSELAADVFDGADYPAHCSAGFDYFLQRADRTVVSFRVDSDIYWGGAHPEYGTAGVTLNTATGEALTLDDVVLDKTVLLTLAARRLQEKYSEIIPENVEEMLLTMDEEQLEWTLGYEGITFYFNPYVILPYATGKTTATIWFEEAEELFNPEVVPETVAGYAAALPLYEAVECARGIELSVVPHMGEYEMYEEIDLPLNGAPCCVETYAYSVQPYVIVTGAAARRCFLYMETVQENGYSTILVFDLNGEQTELIGEYPATGFDGGEYSDRIILTDPDAFPLETRLDMLGTRFGRREYSVDPDTGLPVAKQDYYDIGSDSFPLTSLIPMKALMLDTQAEETLPAGTEFYALRTDGETYMDFRLNDGRECRFEVDTSEYPNRIDGIPEDECFDGFVYAG